MTFTERLEGTELKEHWLARCICGFLDGIESMGVTQFPSVRTICVVADASRTDGKTTSTKTVSKMLGRMDEEGIISLITGRGRNTNTYDIPKDGNLLADKMAKYKIKVEQYEKEMRKAAEEDLRNGVIDMATLNRMIADFTAHDEEWNCYFERDVIAGKAKRYNAGMQYNRNKKRYMSDTTSSTEQKAAMAEKSEREKVVDRHVNLSKNKKAIDKEFDEWMERNGYKEINPEIIQKFKNENNIE